MESLWGKWTGHYVTPWPDSKVADQKDLKGVGWGKCVCRGRVVNVRRVS